MKLDLVGTAVLLENKVVGFFCMVVGLFVLGFAFDLMRTHENN